MVVPRMRLWRLKVVASVRSRCREIVVAVAMRASRSGKAAARPMMRTMRSPAFLEEVAEGVFLARALEMAEGGSIESGLAIFRNNRVERSSPRA